MIGEGVRRGEEIAQGGVAEEEAVAVATKVGG